MTEGVQEVLMFLSQCRFLPQFYHILFHHNTMEMVIELLVKKTKQIQDYTAGRDFNLEKGL